MNKPVLVIMAAGLGSRYGGSKQIDPVDDQGHILMDFSLYDARRAGFEKVIFIIREEHKEVFNQMIGKRIADRMEAVYAFQNLSDIPEGFEVPEGRSKPWGTGHAVLSAASQIDGPFAVINADDYYGRSAYSVLYDFLTQERPENEHAMVAYLVKNTVTENGSVARGVCEEKNGLLTGVTERTRIEKRGSDAAYTEDGEHWVHLPGDTLVSMNCWAFGNSLLQELCDRFPAWLDKNLPVNPLKCEYFIPLVVNDLIQEGRADVRLLNCHETWYGMTYKEDMQTVIDAIAAMHAAGIYPETLLD